MNDRIRINHPDYKAELVTTVYDGVREGVPEQWKSRVALLDTIDSGFTPSGAGKYADLKGVGEVYRYTAISIYYMD